MRRKVINVLVPTILGLLVIVWGVILGYGVGLDAFEHTSGLTTATPISQQKIGDDVNPDILIIYEAEVDGETVYPTVIKEAK